MDVASLDSLVTDSAASSAAWGCGHRVNNAAVNLGPSGERYAPILVLAREAGKATGLVTTATVTHATPAGFAANVANRRQEADIAVQYLEREFDVILGGGQRFFAGDKREDGRDLVKGFAEKGYQCVRTRAELQQAKAGRGGLLGLFTDSHLPYVLDHIHDAELQREVPTLAEMARAALDRLSLHPNGFVVQIEGAKVDMGAHANDIGGMLFDQVAFDETIRVVLEFTERNPDTLVILTTDHGNANPGMSSGPAGGAEAFGRLAEFRGTHGAIVPRIHAGSSVAEIRGVLNEVTRLPITVADAEILQARLRETYRAPYRRMNGIHAVLGQVLANYTDIGWMSHTHTSDYVELLAWGPGSERIKPFNRNTDLFQVMVASAGISVAVEV
jgi:alkaline phosphatase